MKRERNSFLTPLDVRVLEGGKRFMLLHRFTYRIDDFTITVPIGFVTDFASIPVRQALGLAVLLLVLGYLFTFWLFLPGVMLVVLAVFLQRLGRQNKAAVIHDWLYQGGSMSGITLNQNGRKMADIIFRVAMRELGVTRWKRNLMWLAVR